jgi:XTP/dITP diphosphohydrolase
MKKQWPFPFVIIATKNRNKLAQFRDLFGKELGLEVKGLFDYPELPEIVEDQDTFEGNARKKAETICRVLGVPVVSDDSGLVVPALGGEPGVYSARYAGHGATDEKNNQKLLERIRGVPESERKGIYVCVMALSVPGEETKVVRGECEGVITRRPRGDGGFGYDPLFFLPSEGKTMAELPPERRYEISHRAKATRMLAEIMKEEYEFQKAGDPA